MTPEDIAKWIGGLTVGGTAFAMLVRFAITSWSRQGLIKAGDDSHKEAIKHANEEALKWEKRYEAELANHENCKRNHEATLILTGEVRNQNKMLRMLLIQRGMTGDEIDKALEIDEGH